MDENEDDNNTSYHLILDIDGTLITNTKNYEPYPRPYLEEFLVSSFNMFDTVSIWSAAHSSWINEVMNKILNPILKKHNKQFHFVWDFTYCKKNYINDMCLISKPLKYVWNRYNPIMHSKNTYILDNTPETYKDNLENAIPIQTYEYEDRFDDNELLKIANIFK